MVAPREGDDVLARLLDDPHEWDPMHPEPLGVQDEALVAQDVGAGFGVGKPVPDEVSLEALPESIDVPLGDRVPAG